MLGYEELEVGALAFPCYVESISALHGCCVSFIALFFSLMSFKHLELTAQSSQQQTTFTYSDVSTQGNLVRTLFTRG